MKHIKNRLLSIVISALIVVLMLFVVPTNIHAATYTSYESTGILNWLIENNDLTGGYYKVKANGETYQIHLYVYNTDQNWTSNMTFGDANDIGTASTNAVNMVAVKVNGNLTVASGVTVEAYRTTYGSSKGFLLFVGGTLTNNGTIRARGAKAPGQVINLYYDPINGYTGNTIAAYCGAGAKQSTTSSLYNDGKNALNGNPGGNGSNRCTGGGGSGAVRNYIARMYPGAGSQGTSYSGGSGGGAAATDRASSRTAGSGAANGGAGGHGAQGGAATGNSGGSTNGWGQAAGGGQGNGPGNNVWSHANASVPSQDTGTGGLLILFASNLNNKGTIHTNGVAARYTTVSKWTGSQGGGHKLTGGSSGGGSTNVYYSMLENRGTITANGGPSQNTGGANWVGGKGGNGSVTLTQIVLEEEFLHPTLSSLEVEGQTMYPTFDPSTHTYGVTLDSETSTVNINATLTNDENTITSGVGPTDIPIGTSTHNVVVTSKIGIIETYSIEFYRPPSGYRYLKNITIDGEGIPGFTPTKLDYNITVPYDSDIFDLNVIRGRTSQEVHGTGEVATKSGNNQYTITVISEDGNYVTNYTLNIFREHSSRLKSVVIDGYEIEPTFDPETLQYTVTIMSTALAVKVDAVAYDEEATISLKGFGYINSSQTGTITVTEPNSNATVYRISIIKEGTPAKTEYDYSCTGQYKTFIAPATGFYKIELWGAQGGNAVGNNSQNCSYNRGKAYGGGCGGFGAYTSGTIKLNKDDTLYVYVGCRGLDAKSGNDRAGGWNGGGSSTYDHSDDEASGSGGGATDIRLVPTSSLTAWNGFESLKSRIMVAGGGGGGSDVYAAGSAGTLTSPSARFTNGATQTTGYAFGYGENAVYRRGNIDVAGGGGGYMGGYSSAANSSNYGNYGQEGTGGTSFVSGCKGCVAINNESTGQNDLRFTNSNIHYSEYVFEDITMIAGGASQPSKTNGYAVGSVSNGYARITMINKNENNFLSNITVKVDGVTKSYTPTFDMEVEDYYVTLASDETEVSISAKPEDSTAKIAGLGKYDIPAGTTDIPITVTAEAGNVKTYTVHVTRPASDVYKPLDIIINGLVPSLCSKDASFCKLTPALFNKNSDTYYITVPSRIKQLYFTVEKAHPYQVVAGAGKVTLNGGENIITIEVTSEDGQHTSSYHYYVTRDMRGNTDLSILEVRDPQREIYYNPDVTEYYLSLPNEYEKIEELIVETDDPDATFEIIGNEDFGVGMNQVIIRVTSADLTETKDYILNAYRERNGNTYISDLQISNDNTIFDLTPIFNKVNPGPYKLTVENDITKVLISATPEVDTTRISGTGNKTLTTGVNNFSLTATAQDGSIEIYNIAITRKKNSNANLSGINVKNGNDSYTLNPIFDRDITTYNVTVVEGLSKIDITATPEVSTTTYKLLDNSTIKVGANTKRVMAIAEDGTTKTYTVIINRPASTNTYLTSLKVEDSNTEYTLTPEFNKEINEYTLEVENAVNSVTVTAVAENKLTKINGNGKYSLAVGENEIRISVTSEDGSVRDYTIRITRKPNTNPYLSRINLSTGTLSPSFDKETYSYSVNVASTVDSITVTGVPEVSVTTVSGNGKYNLVTGNNTITLTTLAEDGTSTHTYTIIVTKDESDNANIRNLYLEEGTLSPSFQSDIISYTTKVPNNVDHATFHVTLEHPGATYEIIGNENFIVGENPVTIKVTAEDRTTKEYNIVVTRREPSTNSDYLATLTVDKGTLSPRFNKETQFYRVSVPYDVTNILVSATPEDSYATVAGVGSHNLIIGENLILVRVTSADGVDRDYQILVTREKNTDARLSSVVIPGSVLVPNFDKDITSYALTTTDTQLTFSRIQPVDENATYEIIGNNFTENKTYEVIIRVTAADGVTTKDYTFTVTKQPSNNNNLASLKIDGYALSPTFNKSTTLYTVTIPNEVMTVNIEAIPEHHLATVTGDGMVSVSSGQNQLMIEVTSESGNTKTYTILLEKEKSGNNYLADLTVNNGTMTPEFVKTTTSYNVVIPNSENQLDLTVILDDYSASYEVIGNENLTVGLNTVNVAVTSENGNIRTYTLSVIREDIVSALLKDLKVKNYEFESPFNTYINSYDLNVDNEITSLDLTVVPLDSRATYVISGNNDFSVGNNTVTITVTSRDDTLTETYTINVNRQAYSNTFLDYLYTDQGDITPTFDRNVLSYSIDVDNSVTSIELIGEAVDKSATVTGLGVHSINPGENKFPITVTTTSGIKRTYYVTVNRSKATDNFLESLEVRNGSTIYTLTPEFDRTNHAYTVDVPIGTSSVDIIGTISNTATVTGLGTKKVVVGDNVYEILVTSENGDINTYTVTVKRTASTNNFLTDLIPSIGVLEPEFSYTQTNYTLNLDSAAGVLSFEYSTEDLTAKVTGHESQVVPDGTSTRIITVTAENGTTKTYTITVNKERTDNAKLKNLSVTDYSFDVTFNPDTYEYRISVPNSKKVLLGTEVIAVADDPNATIVKPSSFSLNTGENDYIVTVIAPDGFTKENYKIIVTRDKGANSLLSNLVVNTGSMSPNFNPNTLNYEWVVKRGEVLTPASLTATPADANSKLEITDQLEVNNMTGNTFTVKVTAEDGSKSTTYTLNVTYDLSSDATLKTLNIDKGYYLPVFNSDTKTYDVYEYIDTESIDIEAIPTVESSTVTSGDGIVNLSSDETTHSILVTAEDGTTEIYTLNIHRTILTDKGLIDLGLNGLNNLDCTNGKCILSPEFNTTVPNYTIKVPYEYVDLDIYVEKNSQQTVKYKISDNYITNYRLPIGNTVVTIEVYDGMNVKTMEYSMNIERCKSNNTNLRSLDITGYDLDPVFNKNTLEYTINIPTSIEEVEINAVPEDSNATTSINGYNYLDEGENDATIRVIAPDGSSKTYIVHIIRSPQFNSYIKNITISTGVFWDLVPNFKQTTYSYTTSISSIYNRVTIEAIPVDPTTVITGTGEFEVVTGSNKFTLVSTATNGQTSIYNINVIKENSKNVNLANLYVDEGDLSPNFEKGITSYEVTVDSDIDKLTVHAILEDKTSSYIITGNEHLITGDNVVSVIVMNNDKSVTKSYQITVHKRASSNNYLSNLKVKDTEKYYDLDYPFNKQLNEYTVQVPYNVDKVTIEATPESIDSVVQGVGDENLVYGLNTRDITVIAADGSTNIYTINIYRNYNLNLKDIISDVGELTPAFNPEVLEYRINLPKDEDKITFIALKDSNLVRVTGNGDYTLNKGDNEIEFVVTAPDNKTKTYKVIVNRGASDNNNIESLTVHEGMLTPEFNKNTTSYQVNIRNIYNKVTLDVELEDPKATYEVIGNSNLHLGSNIVTVRVTAEDNTTKDYDIEVIVQDESEFSNRLLNITLSNGSLAPDFDPDINYYTATVPNSITDTVIEVVKENIDATVTGVGQVNLAEGRNVFNIPVISKDGVVNTYIIAIYRLGANDATLSSLAVAGYTYTPIFNKVEENYALNIGSSIDKLDITAIPSDPKSKVEIIGNDNLQTGINIINIKVTAPDNETTKTYKLTITKNISTNNYLSSLTVNGYTYTPAFDKTVSGPYVVNLSTNVNNIVIDAEPEEMTTTVTGTGKHDLSPGQNVIQILATSESGSVRTYTVIVNKAKNSDSTLKNILLSDGTLAPAFDPAILKYTVDVPTELDKITITGTPNDLSSTVTGNGVYELDNHSKTVDIVVKAEDGSKTIYQVTINKPSEYSSKLASLIVKDGELSPNFNKNTLSYTISVPNEITSLDMTYIPEDSLATVNVTGNNNFVVGSNTVKVTVTSRDSLNSTEYEIEVMRQRNASNYLKDLYVTGYDITPEFNKETLYYEVSIPNSVENITINTVVEDPSSTVVGNGIKTLAYGDNTFYVKVTSASGIVRTYTVKVNRVLETENYLLSLTSDKGILNPVFDKMTNTYTLTLPEKTTEINLTGTSSQNTTITGLGKVLITDYNIEHSIIVTSQNGDINTYKLNISKPASSNTDLISLTPSSSTLSPNYSNNTLEYTMEVEDNVNLISFNAVLADPDATISGIDITNLDYGDNEITIVVTAEDKVTKREITITINRKKDLLEIIPDPEKTDLVLSKGQVENVTYTLNPADTSYPEVEWISLDEHIATVDQDGNITAVDFGATTIQIVSTHDRAIFANITINVINDKITSTIYDINRYTLPLENNEVEVEHVIGIEPETLLNDFIANFDNNPSTLHVFDVDDNEITDKDQVIGSYMTIKLIIDNHIYDELVIVVRGDFDGDGYVAATDLVGVKNIILGKADETYIRNKICDIDLDNYVAATDLVAVKNFILGKGTLNNKE